MQQAIPYKSWLQMPRNPLSKSSSQMNAVSDTASSVSLKGGKGDLKEIVKENPVIVFGKRGCCMTHVVKRLLQGLGVNPPIFEVDEKDENEVIKELELIGAGEAKEDRLQFPAVFIGGKLFGGLDRIMASHITGELTPVLKKAGALWL